MKKCFSHPLWIIFLLYLMAYLPMLLNKGIFWDDWGLFDPVGLEEAFRSNGGFYAAYLHRALQVIAVEPPLVYHALTFILMFFTVKLFYDTLSFFDIGKNNQFMLSAIFAVLPINTARIYMICIPYAFGSFFCFAGIYLFTMAYYKQSIACRVMALAFCVISFLFLQSSFVFIPAYIAFLFILSTLNTGQSIKENVRTLFVQLLKYIDFVVLTLATWIWLSIFAKPTGLYAADKYNMFTVQSLAAAPLNLLRTFIASLNGLTDFTINNPFMTFVFVIILALVFFLLRKQRLVGHRITFNVFCRGKSITVSVFALLGIYFFVAGALAYIMVDKTPTYLNPESRHQILLGTGISLMLLDFLIICLGSRWLKYVFIVLLSLFITVNLDQYLAFQRAYYKQLAIMTEMKNEEKIASNRNFLVVDNLYYGEAAELTFYAFTGMAKKVFGDETRLLINKWKYDLFISKFDICFLKESRFNTKDIVFNGQFDCYIVIEPGKLDLLRTKNILKLMVEEYFFKAKFVEHIGDLLTLNCLPIPNESE